MYPIKARNGSVFEPNKAPSVGLTLGLLDRPFCLLKLVMFDNSMKIQAKRNFWTAMVGSGQVLLDSDKSVELSVPSIDASGSDHALEPYWPARA
ncbi:hypothetical protein Bca52824_047625 [Brassica carinata]|uniref:Uncharacterized protein n=1 Tax=Brassica carinata TaxID=52824 RepID=A0A8X7UTG9_BRACI|nr:hypothetical protein Bca52824_047625 [Brassica carinata]